jgi:hypothetical protein
LKFAHTRFATACSVSLLLSVSSLLSAGDGSDALLLAEIAVPILAVVFSCLAIVERHYQGGT